MQSTIATFTEGKSALLATAIHAGSGMRPTLLAQCTLTEQERLREEDPFTDIWTHITDNRIVGLRSRFEVDLNRPREMAVYRTPEEAWGLNVWSVPLKVEEIVDSLDLHDAFYADVARLMDRLLEKHPHVVVYDFHSYNHQRSGPGLLDDPQKNPEINLGTGNMDRRAWAPVVDALIDSLRGPRNGIAAPDVRENVKFKGGYFSRWLYARYGARVCPIAIEMKKVFMDEWTGRPDHDAIDQITELFARTVEPVMHAAHVHQETT